MNIEFPEKRTDGDWQILFHRYYNLLNEHDLHFPYVLNMFKYVNANIVYFNPAKSKNWKFIRPLRSRSKLEMIIDGKNVLFEFGDYDWEASSSVPLANKFDAIFVVHWFDDIHNGVNNIFPLCPVNFTDWSLFEELRKNVVYAPTKDKLILHNQRPMDDDGRREKGRNLIIEHYPSQFDVTFYEKDQRRFFMNLNDALVSVHVPGCREDILDRGQTQMFGLGACTISPYMKEKIAGNIEIEAWKHYVPCQPDLSDLVNKIEWCKANVDRCKEIGDNAKELFYNYIHPFKLVKWISACLKQKK